MFFIFHHCWLFRWLSPIASKLKDSILPVRPVRNCRQDSSLGLRTDKVENLLFWMDSLIQTHALGLLHSIWVIFMSQVRMAPALATAPLKAKARVAVSPDLEPMFRYTVWGGRNEMTTWQHSWQLELTVLPSVETTNDRDYLVGRYLKYGKSKIFLQNRIVILIHCRLLTNALHRGSKGVHAFSLQDIQ